MRWTFSSRRSTPWTLGGRLIPASTRRVTLFTVRIAPRKIRPFRWPRLTPRTTISSSLTPPTRSHLTKTIPNSKRFFQKLSISRKLIRMLKTSQMTRFPRALTGGTLRGLAMTSPASSETRVTVAPATLSRSPK